MPIAPGEMLAHYRLVEKIGEGGMGVVWKAVDTQLNREVALKVLPDPFATDHDRLVRFQREAQLLASLNHPNIAQIHGLVEAGGVRALALELVEGTTLEERLLAGPIPLAEALPIATQIAEALETAHDRGIIHRDLKPANIKITPEGAVKVLDFGLAKAMEGESGSAGLASSPTLTAAATQVGVILGTAAYMSPEQARGKTADRRADIWGFGVVLFEMLAGGRLHAGESVSETLAAVMKDAPDWNTLPGGTPEPIRRLLRRCLEKNPRQRLRDIGEVRIAIAEHLANPSGISATLKEMPAERKSPWNSALPWVLTAAATAAAIAAFLVPRAQAPEPVRLNAALTEEAPLFVDEGAAAVLSPDGRRIAFVAGEGGSRMLYIRDLGNLQATTLAGTEGARNPFFSPDGDWLGFFTSNKLKKVSVTGGAPLPICDAQDSRGGTWGADGTIVFAPTTVGGLLKVSSLGGQPQPLTERDTAKNERSHRWPSFLPDGRHVLFMAQVLSSSYEEATIEAVALDTGQRKVIHRGGVFPRYMASGHLAFLRDSTLFIAPFDAGNLEVTGLPTPQIEGVLSNANNGGSQFDVSRTGTLLYMQGTVLSAMSTIVWVDRQGVTSPLFDEVRSFEDLRLSPDGRRIAVEVNMPGGQDIIWVYDIERQTMTRLTFVDGAYEPIWTPDGQRVVYATQGEVTASPNLHWKRADGGGAAEQLTFTEATDMPFSWTPDGRVLAFLRQDPKNGWDIWTLTPGEADSEQVFLSTPFIEGGPAFSPDGRWIAYQSDESGDVEVYVRPFPGPGGKWQISSGGGSDPRWSGDGRELFFRNEDSMMAVPMAVEGDSLRAGTPQELFSGKFVIPIDVNQAHDVTADGQRFIMLQPTDMSGASHTHVNMVFNWFEEIDRLSAAAEK